MNKTKYICYDVPHQSNHFCLTMLECISLKFFHEQFNEIYSEFQLYRNLFINRDSKHFIKLVSINDEFVGIIHFEVFRNTNTGLDTIVVDYIAVREEYRKQGFASLLVNEAIQSVENIGLIVIYGALKECFECYKKMGFIKAANGDVRK